jgi:glycosyl transferase, family 25
MTAFYCINLKRDIERRAKMLEAASTSGIDLIFIDATEGSGIDIENSTSLGYDRSTRLTAFSDMSKNEIACLLSHKRALQNFLAGQQEFAVVLEDDAALAQDFSSAIEGLTHNVINWDIIKLECRRQSPKGLMIVPVDETHKIYVPLDSEGTTGLLYSRVGAEKTLSSLNTFSQAFDTHLGFAWKYDLRIAQIFPSLVWERRDDVSSIGNRQRAHTGKSWRARWLRLQHSVCKRLHAQRVHREITIQ